MQIDDQGNMVELRAGTNGWMCLSDDNPAAPGNAPIGVDGPWASNEDPFATAPPEGRDWVQEPPHLMIIVPDPAMLSAFPTDDNTGAPFVMWSGAS